MIRRLLRWIEKPIGSHKWFAKNFRIEPSQTEDGQYVLDFAETVLFTAPTVEEAMSFAQSFVDDILEDLRVEPETGKERGIVLHREPGLTLRVYEVKK